ncbi:uracil-DNA glycosylase [Paenibacillus oryzae]|uniref:Uracil-DNA glycosylase n=1 Tax=Paenibacillus oryzae TaxID=1844972 RepID=A0A1A5YH83_9BACL|nr:uracil-DNA glycosylase [Paenibacillus oryzae]OBR64952.1 uracil-DNA glycosylase [Paenibacillus oryzae]
MIDLPDNDWRSKLQDELEKPYLQKLWALIEPYYEEKKIYPPKEDVFNALHFTPYSKVKVLILGQDPYHGEGQSHGLCFSVRRGVKQPPSLKNIFKELETDLGHRAPAHGELEAWAKQGVLLLNTVLTVEDGQAASHQKLGWEIFTDRIISLLNERETPIVFVLWGRHAQAKKAAIDTSRHFIIESAHPSPLSARTGFFGSKPFSKANEFLMQQGIEPIDWEIRD